MSEFAVHPHKDGFGVFNGSEVISYLTTQEQAEEFADRLNNPPKTGASRKPTPPRGG